MVTTDDLALARRAVDRVVAHNSELAALWADHGPESGWHQQVRALLSRLPEGSAAGVVPEERDEDPHLQSKVQQFHLGPVGGEGDSRGIGRRRKGGIA